MDERGLEAPAAGSLLERYRAVRRQTERLCAPLAADDYQVQSTPEVSPPKWHLAHTSWFFETFLLRAFEPSYRPFHPRYEYLFNSYYETVGTFHPRDRRGLLARPTVEEVYRYRAHVDAAMGELIETTAGRSEVAFRVTLGLNHEQQHQELLLMDVKHNFAANPLRPPYHSPPPTPAPQHRPALRWLEGGGEVVAVGHEGTGFAFDNETPRHQTLLARHRLAARLVTSGEYLEFIEAGGYRDARPWLADGWHACRARAWEAPLYWEKDGSKWWQMTLGGMRPVAEDEPICHVSFYEADAFARWRGGRLPSEHELEAACASRPVRGNFAESGRLHPSAAGAEDGQWFGDVWEWTRSPYAPYPGFRPLPGSLGEYNGKFMCNQLVLRGGCCATPRAHMRATYRNFFYPHDRWPFTGIRLAEDV
jgi:ergothioneine biosynthesis protein EgtB